MTTRRSLLSLIAGATLLFAGCSGPDGSAGDGLGIEAGTATVGPGEEAAIEIQASAVGVVTWQPGDVPENWQMTPEDFDPEPTAVRESYPPQLVWDPAEDSVTGTIAVMVADDAVPGQYTFPVEAQSETGDENVVADAVISVDA